MLKSISLVFILLLIDFPVSAQTIVKGIITGSNGQPMKMANVILAELPDYSPIKSVNADSNGSFTITIDTPGMWMLQLNGVFHRSHFIALYITKKDTISINIQLEAYDYVNGYDGVKVTGNFNNWYILSALPMQKQPDGTYTAEIESDLDTILYQLKYVRNDGDIEGTQADKYLFTKSGGYYSAVVVKNRKAKIIFNPQMLVKNNQETKCTFETADSITKNFSNFYDEFLRYQRSFQSSFNTFMKSRGRTGQFTFDTSNITSFLRMHLQKKTDSLLLQELYMLYLGVMVMNKVNDKTIYQTALEKISPSSPVWLLNAHHMYYALNHSGYSDQQQDEYIQKVLEENPVSRVKSAILFDEFHAAKYSGQDEKASNYYDMLTNNYSDTPEAKQIKKLFPHELDLKIGSPVPKFAAPSMDDSIKILTNQDFQGKYTLLHFWAASHKPSADEIELLQKIYKKYKSRKFEIISFSVDSTSMQVLKFRKTQFKMPWIHVFIGPELENKIVRDYQVNTIPKCYLIDPKGNLIAMDSELHGVNLEKTLRHFISK